MKLIILIIISISLFTSCESVADKHAKYDKKTLDIMFDAERRLKEETNINPRSVWIEYHKISVTELKERYEYAILWSERVDAIIDSINAIKSQTSTTISNSDSVTIKAYTAECNAFKDGYKGILWSWSAEELINFYKARYYIIRDNYDYSISDGRTSQNINFRKGTYKDYRSDNPMKERSFSFLNNKLYGIEFFNYISWNYTYEMALEAAEEVAKEYNLPKMVNQYRGGTNIVWYADCPDYRVYVQFYWGSDIIDGEANRYIAVKIMNLEKDTEMTQIQNIARSEERIKLSKKLSDEL